MERTTSTANRDSSGPMIDIIDLDSYSYRAPERFQGSFLTLEELSDSEDEADVHIAYEIESDKVAPKSRKRGRRGKQPADLQSEEDDYHTPSSPKRHRTDDTQKKYYLRNKSIRVVPSEVWLKIFSFSQPAFLARARRISKDFRILLDDEKVWRCARVYHFPRYPDPVFGLKEWEMWGLYLGTGCMICHAPKTKNRYWRFRIRCCVNCLEKVTIKVFDRRYPGITTEH